MTTLLEVQVVHRSAALGRNNRHTFLHQDAIVGASGAASIAAQLEAAVQWVIGTNATTAAVGVQRLWLLCLLLLLLLWLAGN